jgi:hypothetical protein
MSRRRIEGVGYFFHLFLTSALRGGERLTSKRGYLPPRDHKKTYLLGGCVELRAGQVSKEERKISCPC